MEQALKSYGEIVVKAGRQPDSVEFLAWRYYGIEPNWYKELVA